MKKWALGVIGIIAIVMAGLALVLFQPDAFRLALWAAGRVLPVTIEVDGYRHVPGSVSFTGLRVSNATGTFLRIGSLEMDYRPYSILHGRLEARRLEVQGLAMSIERLEDGGLNILPGPAPGHELGSAGEPAKGVTRSWRSVVGFLELQAIRGEDISLSFQDRISGISLAWRSLSLEGSFSGGRSEGDLRVRHGLLEVGRGQSPPVRMATEGRMWLRGDTLGIDPFRVSSEGALFAVRATYCFAESKTALQARLEAFPVRAILEALGQTGMPVDDVTGSLQVTVSGRTRARIEADLQGTAYGQEVYGRLKGALEQGTLRAESLEIGNPEASFNASLSWEISSGDLVGRASLVSSRLQDSFRLQGIPGLCVQGLRLDGSLSGTISEPRAAFRARVECLSYHDARIEGISARGGYEAGQGLVLEGRFGKAPFLSSPGRGGTFSARLSQARAECSVRAAPALEAEFSLDRRDHRVEVAARFQDLDLSFVAADRIPGLSAFCVSGESRFSGRLDDRRSWVGDGRIEELRLSVPGVLVRTDRPIHLGVKDGLLSGSAALRVNRGVLAVRGAYPLAGSDPIRAMVNAFLLLEDLEGPARALVPGLRFCEGNLRVEASLVGHVGDPRLKASVDLSDGWVWLSGPEADEPKQGTASHEGRNPALAGPWRGQVATARLGMSVRLEGRLRSPAGSVHLRLAQGRFHGVGPAGMDLEAQSRDGIAWNGRALVRVAGGEVVLHGRWHLPSGAIAGKIRSSEFDLAGLLGSREPPVKGTGTLKGSISGRLKEPELRCEVPVKDLWIGGHDLGDLAAAMVLSRQGLSARVRMRNGSLEASVRFGKEAVLSVLASLQDLPVTPFLGLAGLEGWTGEASLSGSLAGPFGEPERWKGRLRIQRMDLAAGGTPVRLEGPVVLAWNQGTLEIPQAMVRIDDSLVRIRGKAGRKNDLAVKGTVPLSPFSSLIPWIRVDRGTIEADLVIRGTPSEPVPHGTCRLVARQVSIPGMTYPLGSVEAALRASGGRVSLETFSARVADGRLTATGSLALDPFRIERLGVRLVSVPVRLSDAFAGRLEGSLDLEGDREDSLLSGRIRIMEARYEEDFQMVGLVLSPRRPRLEAVRSPDPFLKNMRLEIKVYSGPELLIRNNVARMLLSADIDLRGTAAAPVLLGTVKVVEGRIAFGKREFEITRGKLAFLDPSGGSPHIQVESRTTVRGQAREYEIYLALNGPLDRIELDLRSVPDLARDDILFVLVTGMTQDEYLASEGPGTGTREAAERLAISGLSTLIGQDIKDWTGLDTFELERAEEEFGLKATVGKRFNERVELRGIFALGSGQEVSEAQVGYRLTDQILLLATQRSDGTFGLDLRVQIGSR